MFDSWTVVTTQGTEGSEEELKGIYGDEAVISRVRGYNLIHLDHPDENEVERRISDFDPDELFDDDCPLCRMMQRHPVDVVFLGEKETCG